MNNEWQTMDNAPKDRLITIWTNGRAWIVNSAQSVMTGHAAWRVATLGEGYSLIIEPSEARAWREAPTKPEWLTD
jgi:hypothetical protein